MRTMKCLACGDIVELEANEARYCLCGQSVSRLDEGRPVLHGPCRIVRRVVDLAADPTGASGWWTIDEDATTIRIPVPPLL